MFDTSSFSVKSSMPDLLEGVGGKRIGIAIIEFNDREYTIGWEKGTNRVSVSDEVYWNAFSPVGDELSSLINLAHALNYQAGIVITPYALREYGGQATIDQLADAAHRSDFILIDPYFLNSWMTVEQLLSFSDIAIDFAHATSKEIVLCLQGFAIPGTEEITAAYNKELLKLPFDDVILFDAIDFSDIPDEWQLTPLPQVGIVGQYVPEGSGADAASTLSQWVHHGEC